MSKITLSSKAAEVDHLRQFVEGLPSSYLRDTLSPFVVEFERGVYSDVVPSVRDSWDARIEADKEVKELRRQVAELQEERRKLVNEIAKEAARFETGVKALREAANVVANASRWASDTISEVKGRIQ